VKEKHDQLSIRHISLRDQSLAGCRKGQKSSMQAAYDYLSLTPVHTVNMSRPKLQHGLQ